METIRLIASLRKRIPAITPLALLCISILTIFMSPSPVPSAHGTSSTGLGIWTQVTRSNAIVNATITPGTLLQFRVNASGGTAFNGFDITVKWNPAVLNATGQPLSIKGGVFDTGIMGDYVQFTSVAAGDHVELAGLSRLTPCPPCIKANGTIFTFNVKVLTIGSTAISIDTGSHLVLGGAIPYTPLNGYFSNVAGMSDLSLVSVSVPQETYALGLTVPITFVVRNIGSTPMAGVTVTTYANSTMLNVTSIGALGPNSNASRTFTWGTSSGFTAGIYNITSIVNTTSPDAFAGDNRLSLERVLLVTHNLAVVSASIPTKFIRTNSSVFISEVVKNLGTTSDYANASIYANSTLIRALTCASSGCSNSSVQQSFLVAGQSAYFQFNWTTTRLLGNYHLQARVATVPYDTNTTDDVYDLGYVAVLKGFAHDLSLRGSLPTDALTIGLNATLPFTVTNNGASNETYIVYLIVNGTVSARASSAQPIAPNATQIVNVIWKPSAPGPGKVFVQANVTILGAVDQNPSNNYVPGNMPGLVNLAKVYDHDLSIGGTLPSQSIPVGKNVTLTFTVTNKGRFSESYTVYLIVNGTVLAQVPSTQQIAANATQTFNLIWRTSSLASGTATVGVNVTITGGIIDENLSNNQVGPGAISLTANAPPTAAFTFSTTTPAPGDRVTFNAAASADPDGSIHYYIWDFGDGATGNGQIVTHTYASAGTYTVKLTVWDDLGAQNTTGQKITVTSPAGVPIVYVAAGLGVAAAAVAALLLVLRQRRRTGSPGLALKKP